MRDHVELANGIYRKSYELLIDGETDAFFFQFDDARTDALPVSITAAKLRAEIEGLDGVESAEVDGEPGDFTIAITATEGHTLDLADDGIGGRYGGQLDYFIA